MLKNIGPDLSGDTKMWLWMLFTNFNIIVTETRRGSPVDDRPSPD